MTKSWDKLRPKLNQGNEIDEKLIIKNLVNYEKNSYLFSSFLSFMFTKVAHRAISGYSYIQKTFLMRCMVLQVIMQINLKEDLQPMAKFLASKK